MGVSLVYLVAAITSPWSFHIGGRSTPLLSWWGSGSLLTRDGRRYPLFVMLSPSSRSSHLRLDGLRPTGGVKGNGCLCLSTGGFQSLTLSGTIYGGWRSTEGALIEFRLHEPTIVQVGQGLGGFIQLYGRFRGPDLVMDDRGEPGARFRSGLSIERPSVTLRWNPYWTCRSACANGGNPPEP